MGRVKDLTGLRFSRLVVVERAPGSEHRSPMWLCRCDCGGRKVTSGRRLRSGHCRSCGCLELERRRKRSEAMETHGMSRTPLHRIWCDMVSRCRDRNSKEFPRYGGRGISVCDEWGKDFRAFRDWALANGYEKGLSIDRIDNDGPYAPWNCRWATKREQARNRRNNRLIYFRGETKTLVEWSEVRGIKVSTLWGRLKRHPPEVALTLPVRKRRPAARRRGARGRRKGGGTGGSGSVPAA